MVMVEGKEVSQRSMGTLPWHANKQAKIWDLIHLIGKDEYFKGLFGKKDPNENTTGKSKTQLFICLARDLWLEFIGNDADVQELDLLNIWGDSLIKKYKEEMAHLHKTGGGVKITEFDGDDWEVYTKINFYVSASGLYPEGFETRIIQPLEEDNFSPDQWRGITFNNRKSMQMLLNKIQKAAQDTSQISLTNTGAKGGATSSGIKKDKLVKNDKYSLKPLMFSIKNSHSKSKKSIEETYTNSEPYSWPELLDAIT
ncbi:hypothetical protein EDD85DRAFT_783284 [Armillaria nabsnona]|nr:hypothetical protein EDD85DRAFT_783284 [Armillaria nabsnona]